MRNAPPKQANRAAYPPIIGFTPNTWSVGASSRGRILSGLADRGWPTIYCSGASTIWEIGRRDWRLQPWLRAVDVHDEMRIDRPGRLLVRWPSRPRVDRVALALHAAGLRRTFDAESSAAPVALLFHPMFWPYVAHLSPRLLVYYAYDAYRLAPGWTDALACDEAALVERADLVIAYSASMLEELPGDAARRGRVLPPGVDAERFSVAHSAPCPADLARIPRPRIGYVGRINQKLDFRLVLEVAARRPEWHWCFVGAIGATAEGRFAADHEAEALWARCRALPNVHVLGPKKPADVPPYLTHMDVNAMCYRTDAGGWWSAIFPLKSLEYLAAGRPVISSRVPSMLPYRENMAFAATTDEWIDAIAHGLAGGVGTPASRFEVARANAWDDRIDRLHEWIADALERP